MSVRGFRLFVAGFAFGSLCLMSSLAVPTSAIALSDQSRSSLPVVIDESIPDDAELISTELAVLDDGSLVYVKDGSVAPTSLMGSEETPVDPLDITGGSRFERISVGEARDLIVSDGAAALSRSIDNGDYGAYWGSYSGEQAFFQSNGSMFACRARGVIDVSEHNGDIDWDAAKADGVEGAIIRIGYSDARLDYKAQRNIDECKRLGIPFGVYLYSYADTVSAAADEGGFIAWALGQLGVTANDLSYPIYYDLEEWSWTGHSPVTDPSVNTAFVEACYRSVKSAGFNNFAVYSYTSWLNTALNSSYIHGLTNWVAQYYGRLTYGDLSCNYRGWQYTSEGSISGVYGDCDLNAFGYASWPANDHDGVSLDSLGERVTDLTEGDYSLCSSLGNLYIDIYNASGNNGVGAIVWPGSGADNQLFHIAPAGNGHYTIGNVATGKNLDAFNGQTANGTDIIQWEANSGANQLWDLYIMEDGTYMIASVNAGSHNKVIDVYDNCSDPGTKLELWAANGGANQRFTLCLKGGSSSEDSVGYTGWNQDRTRWYDNDRIATEHAFYDASSDAWYWADADGSIACDKDVFIPKDETKKNDNGTWGEGKWVRFDADRKMVKDEDYRYGAWYYFDLITGEMSHGDVYLPSSGGKWVRYDSVTGRMVYGPDYRYGAWYYFDTVTGAMAHGEVFVPDWSSIHYFDWITGRG